jgi:hypothetical protein
MVCERIPLDQHIWSLLMDLSQVDWEKVWIITFAITWSIVTGFYLFISFRFKNIRQKFLFLLAVFFTLCTWLSYTYLFLKLGGVSIELGTTPWGDKRLLLNFAVNPTFAMCAALAIAVAHFLVQLHHSSFGGVRWFNGALTGEVYVTGWYVKPYPLLLSRGLIELFDAPMLHEYQDYPDTQIIRVE